MWGRAVFQAYLSACWVITRTWRPLQQVFVASLAFFYHGIALCLFGRLKPYYTHIAGPDHHVRNPIARLTRTAVSNYVVDVPWVVSSSAHQQQRALHGVDLSELCAALGEGKGVVLTFPHTSTPQVACSLMARSGIPVTVVGMYGSGGFKERLVDAWSDRSGIEMIQVDPGATGPTGVVAAAEDALHRGRVVAMAGDIYVSRKGGHGGIKVDLAGRERTIGVGPALLSARTGAPIVPMVIHREHGERQIDFLAAIHPENGSTVETLMPTVTQAVNTLIARAPEQWMGVIGDARYAARQRNRPPESTRNSL